MVEKKEKIVCIPVHLRIGSKGFSGFLCKDGKKFEYKPADEEQLKYLKRAVSFDPEWKSL